MLDERQIRLVVTPAMTRYAAKNDGKRGMTREDVINAVAEFGGDLGDVRIAMVEGMSRIAPDYRIYVR